ncbi:hypothetical protein BCR43DRAFT_446828 [Syncephalastrum racemosum]|uniref:E3 ubiquitin-protein ligase listerin n=1 Tax=Syncephalastrum racemosum TaxID=13706 RepID=A0A1X2H1C8_SYNRA|nr:hypothetical protein BCR43DRAFT_446828 [Syncephalastrum racemosum]
MGLPSSPAAAASAAVSMADDAHLDPDLVVIFRKMAKRDAVTKLKALEDLESYLRDNTAAIASVIPLWARSYVKLTIEVDRRVRLAANSVHDLMARHAKKKLAPHLKELIGAWMISQFDQSKDVARMAQQSFCHAFSEDKRLGVLQFCQKEILEYLSEMLLSKEPDTLSDARYVTKEEMEAKFARVISACFCCLSYLLDTLLLEDREKCQDDYDALMQSPRLWKFVTHEQPLIRRSLYHFTKSLLVRWTDLLEKEPTTFSDLWDAILLMTKQYPESWMIIGRKKAPLPKLCALLKNGLNGAVSVGYPGLLVLFANLPPEMSHGIKFYQEAFPSFWKGLSTDKIDRTNAHVFTNAYAECAIYCAVTQSNLGTEESNQIATYLVVDILGDLVKAYLARQNEKLMTDQAQLLASHLSKLGSLPQMKDMTSPLWTKIDRLLVQTTIDCSMDRKPVDMVVFSRNAVQFVIALASEKAGHQDVVEWAHRMLLAALGSALVYKDKANALLGMADWLVMEYHTLIPIRKKQINDRAKSLLPLMWDMPEESLRNLVSFYLGVIARIPDDNVAKELWDMLLKRLDGLEAKGQREQRILLLCLDQVQSPNVLVTVFCHELLDQLFEHYSLQPSAADDDLVYAGLQVHFTKGILSDDIVGRIFAGFAEKLHSADASSTLGILQKLLVEETSSAVIDYLAEKDLATIIFDQASMSSEATDAVTVLWDSIIRRKTEAQSEKMLRPLLRHVKATITDVKNSVSPSTSVRRVSTLLDGFCGEHDVRQRQVLVSEILGSEEEWHSLSSFLAQPSLDVLSLTIHDPMTSLVQGPFVENDELAPVTYDVYGLSAAGRLMLFAAELVHVRGLRDTLPAEAQAQLLQKLTVTSVLCQYGLAVPGVYRLWNSSMTECNTIMRLFVDQVQYLLDDFVRHAAEKVDGPEWSQQLLNTLGDTSADIADTLVSFAARLARYAVPESNEAEVTLEEVAAAEAFHLLLSKSLQILAWTPEVILRWLTILKAEATTVRLPIKVAILQSIKGAIGESAAYRNLQSDYASKLSGVTSLLEFDEDQNKGKRRSSKTKSDTYPLCVAWNLLVLLNTSSLKFGAIAIPPQRLMHLLLTVRKWFEESSEHDLSEEQRIRVIVQLLQLFIHLAESVQEVSGGQWEFFLERSREWATYYDTSRVEELAVVYHALQLYHVLLQVAGEGHDELADVIQDHAEFYNDVLNLISKERYMQGSISRTRSQYQGLLTELQAFIPEDTLKSATDIVTDMCALIKSPSEVLQKCAYRVLKFHIVQTVQDLSVRLELSSSNEEEPTDASLEKNILQNISEVPNVSAWHTVSLDEMSLHDISGYMISWLLLFEHFSDITFRLKQEYTSQLKEAELISHLIPFLSQILGVGAGQYAQPFDLTPWDFEMYDLEGFDTNTEMSYLTLAAHLYYRSLKHIPSLVRQWWVDSKNRQLTIGVESFIEKYFSSQLISDELDLIGRPDVQSLLEGDDEFTVKALRAAREVTARYRVDEQDMQIAIKLPSTYPLQQIDVEGVQKVGVSDRQWRGWMFSVAAVIGAQNGNIVDALTVFRRNVRLHFDGVEDCTICYSIISAQDRSIPTKQCRTCKNKFHASCLYKWFRSSNSASCPLCRTVF